MLELAVVVRIWGDIVISTGQRVCESIDVAIAKKVPSLIISLDTKGGLVSSKDMIVDAIERARQTGIRVEGLVLGDAMSAGFSILQACTVRHARPNAQLMFHSPGPGTRSVPRAFVSKQAKSDCLIFDYDIEHQIWLYDFAGRCGQPIEQIAEWNDSEREFTAQEALDLNFIDQIVVGPRIG